MFEALTREGRLSRPLDQEGTFFREVWPLCAAETLNREGSFSLGWFLVRSGFSLLLAWAERVLNWRHLQSQRLNQSNAPPL